MDEELENKYSEEIKSELFKKITSTVIIKSEGQVNLLVPKFSRKKIRLYLKKEFKGVLFTKSKLKVLDTLDEELSNAIEKHINYCEDKNRCKIENIYLDVFNYLDYKKNELLATKSFWERLLDSPISWVIALFSVLNFILK